MRPVFSDQTGARILGNACHIEPEREGFALVRAQAQAEASELVFRAAHRTTVVAAVVAARRVVEHERARAPGTAEPRSEIRAVALEREALADVARSLALVVAAHAVRAAHPELLAGDEQVFRLLGVRGRAQDEIHGQELREHGTRAPDRVRCRSAGARGRFDKDGSSAVQGSTEGLLIAVRSTRKVAR